MTDLVEIAKERQARLAAEFGRLDDFIRMAEAMVKNSQSKSSTVPDTEDEKAAGGNGAKAEREDISVCKLTAKELMRNLRTTHNEPALDRREQFHFRERA